MKAVTLKPAASSALLTFAAISMVATRSDNADPRDACVSLPPLLFPARIRHSRDRASTHDLQAFPDYPRIWTALCQG